jgi:hypothetical protein
MPKNQMKCPRCQQPILVQVEQLFDVSADPAAKQRLLGGVSNFANCSACGYAGGLSTPIVYHDNDKELLLTYFPPELGMPLNEQERLFGPLINQAVNKLPAEKRKAYLFRPQSFLTYQSLVERILGADGITPEMIKAQQAKANLIEKLLAATSDDVRKSIIQQESALVDAEFFALFSRLMESALASGQEDISKQMDTIQQILLNDTDYGKELQNQANEIQEAVKTLKAVGNKLTREKLLEILLDAPNDIRLGALVSYTRQGLDYQFFQLITDRIEKETSQEMQKLESFRSKLLDLTREIDQRMEADQKHAVELLGTLLSSENLQVTLSEHLPEINDTFIQILNHSMQEATEKQDQVLLEKLQQIVAILQQFSAPPPEYGLLQKLIEAPDDLSLDKLLVEHDSELTQEFSQFLSGIIAQSEAEPESPENVQDAKVLERIQRIYRAVLKNTMMKNLK